MLLAGTTKLTGLMSQLLTPLPPYRLAQEFVDKALSLRRNKYSIVAMLLRLNCLGSKKRAKWHRDNPASVYVTPKRPTFTGGGTDATEYAWFVWQDSVGPQPIVILHTEAVKTARRKKNPRTSAMVDSFNTLYGK